MDNAIKAKVRQLISQWTDVGRQRASTVIVHVMCMYTSTSSHTSMYYKYLYATSTRDVYISVYVRVCVCVCVCARACVVWQGKTSFVCLSLCRRGPRPPGLFCRKTSKHPNGSRRPTDHRYRGLLAKYFQPAG